MISGAHVILYSKNAEADRAFFRDVLAFKSVDAGHGWLVFSLPPAEAAFHPSDEGDACELYAGAHAERGLSPTNEETIRKYYAAWETRDWHPIDILLADNFTFTRANNDDHISKSTFKARCWESQIDFMERFHLERVIGNGNEAFVLYVGRTKNGKTFRNVEYLRLRDHKVEAIECYFGAPSSFPSAVSAG